MAGTPSNDLNISQAGYVVFDGIATFTGRTLIAGTGISITNPSGIAGDSTISLAGAGVALEHLTGNSGGALNPDGANNINILTANATIKFAGSGSTLTQDFSNTNLILGSSAASLSGAAQNVGLGALTLNAVVNGTGNTVIGWNAGKLLTSGSSNTYVGNIAGNKSTTCQSNTGIGNQCLFSYTTTTGTAGGNTALGSSALTSLTTGVSNIAIGNNSGTGYSSSESSNIVIGAAGTTAESNVLRIGNQGSSETQQNKCFIAGIVSVTASNPVLVTINSSTSQLGVQALTQYNLVTGGASNAVNLIAPSATSGVPVISQGASAQPIYGTAVVAGGGTGAVTLTSHGVLIGQGTSAVTATAAGTAGQLLKSGGASADPSYTTATYPSTGGTSGNVITSDGTNFSSSALPTRTSNALATMASTVSNVTGDNTFYGPIIFDTATFNVGTNYSVSTGFYTAPVTGKYLCCCSVSLQNLGAAHTTGEFRLLLNGSTYTRSAFNPFVVSAGGIYTYTFSLVISATAADTLSFGCVVSGSTKTVGIQGNSFGNYSFASFTLIG